MNHLNATQILFVDARANAADPLLAGGAPGYELVPISADEDGLAQVARALQGRSNVAGLHFMAGADGNALQFGSGALDLAALDPAALQALHGALAADATLHLHGQPAGADVAAFTGTLAEATGLAWGDADFAAPALPAMTPAPHPAAQILFIDAHVDNAESFLADVDPSVEVVRLNANEDGLVQIARTLDGRSGIGAVHIVSHGDPGSITLGNGTVDSDALASHAAELATIRSALSPSADVLLYGCDVAADPKGMAFLSALADATGADVAASTDVTGSPIVGGNWTLEAQVGSVQTLAIQALDYAGDFGNDSSLPAGLQGAGPTWSWGSQTFQTKYDGDLTTSDPVNTLRSGCYWDRYALSGIATGTTVRVYMGNSSTVDDYLQIERNGSVITYNDDGGDGERSYDAYVSWTYQVGDVIRATTYSAGNTGTYSLFVSTSAGAAGIGDIGNAPAPAPPPATAPTFTDSFGTLATYTDTGAADTFSATAGTLTATDTTPNGGMTFSVNGSSTGTYGSLSVAANGSFAYTPSAAAINALAAGASASDSFTVRVTDGGGLFSSKTLTVNVVGANDAPTIASDATMPTIAEDASASNAGATVASMFGARFADVDNGSSLGGIVIVDNTANASTEGRWQYSTNGGSTWFDVGSVSAASGLTLAAGAKLHFVPVADFNGAPGGLTVNGTDNNFVGTYSNGAGRITFDTTNDAATSGVSVATHTLDISVAAVNDAPVFTSAAGAATLDDTPVYDGTFIPSSGSVMGTLAASDVDNASNTLAYSIRGGSVAATTWTKAGLYGTLTLDSATHDWVYTPDNTAAINALTVGDTAHDVFEFKVADPAGGYSTQAVDITINGTNDLPVLHAAIGDQAFAGSGSWGYQLPADTFRDAEGRGLEYTVEVVDGSGVVLDTIGATTGGNSALASSWLTFDEASRTFSGNPSAIWGDAPVTLRVTATDPSGAAVSDTFDLTLAGTANQGPVVSHALAPLAVAAVHEVTSVTFSGSLGGTTIAFDGSGPITLGADADADTVRDAVVTAFGSNANAHYAAVANGAGTVQFTALTAGALTDVTDVVGAGNYASAGGGSAPTINVTTQGADAATEVATVSFNDNISGDAFVIFDGAFIGLNGSESAQDIRDLFIAQGQSANWTFSAGVQPSDLVLTHKTSGAVADIVDSNFDAFPFEDLVASTHVDTQGAAAVAEVFEVTYGAAHGGSTLVFDGVTATAGAAVSAADVATAVLGGTYTNHSVVAGGTPDTVVFTANDAGPQGDIGMPDFTGFVGGGHVNVDVQGANWSYQIPANTFSDAEGDTLTYAAYAIDGAGTATLIGHLGGALDFDPATRTLSGDGTALGANIVEIRATDATGSNTTAVARLPLFLDDGSTYQQVTAGNAISTLALGTGAGELVAQLPADAFFYGHVGGSLSYAATLAGGSALPSWLHFDTSTGTFSGNPPNGAADISVEVVATDSANNTASTSPFTLTLSTTNDPIVLVAPIADHALAAGNALGYTVSLPFSDPDGTAAGGATTGGIIYGATANGQSLASFGLSMVDDGNGHLVFSGNPPGGTPYLNIVVTGTETAGGSSAQTSFTLNLNDANVSSGALSANNAGTVSISGTPTQGQTLTADVPVDADGYSGTVTYQWQVNTGSGWVDVTGARGQQTSLTLTQAEVGQVRLQAFYTDNGGVAEAPISSAVSVANLPDAGVVSITGSPSIGHTISAALSDDDGLSSATPTYQWYSGNSAGTATNAIAGATYSSYTVGNADGGKFLRVVVSYTDDGGTHETPAATTAFAISLGDVAPVGVNDNGNASEAGGVNNAIAGTTASGNLVSNDTDTNNNIVVATAITAVRSGGTEGLGAVAADDGSTYTIAGSYGTLVVTKATGAYVYSVDNSNAAVDALNNGDTIVDHFNYTVQDATLLSDTAVLNITIAGANDKPSITGIDATAAFTEDLAAELRLGSIQLVDPDLGASYTLKLQVSAGTLMGTGNADVTVTGTDSGTLIVTGTMDAVQLWLGDGGIFFRSAPNGNGNATLTYSVNDGTGYLTAGTTTLQVAAVNDAAVVDLNGADGAGNNHTAIFRPRGDEVAVVDTDVVISDVDDTLITGATVALTSGAADNSFGTTFESLRSTAGASFTGGSGHTITISGNGGTTLTFSGSATHAEYEALLKTVMYSDTNPNAYSGDRTVTISVTDAGSTGSALASNGASFATAAANNAVAIGQHIYIGGVDSGEVVSAVIDNQHFVASGTLTGLAAGSGLSFYSAGAQVTTATQSGPVIATTTVQVPWTPVMDLNGESTAGRDNTVIYTEGGAPVAVATSDASITDQDGNIAQVVVTLTNPQDGAAEKLSISSALVTQLNALGITVTNNNSDAITLSGNRDATFFQVGLRAVTYLNTSENPSTVDRVVSVSSLDVDGNTGVGASTTITMHAVNDAPNGIDSSITTTEDTPHTFAASDFGFSDPVDGVHHLFAVKISTLPADGVIRLDGTAVTAGQTISLADLNAGKLSYAPAADHAGNADATFTFQVQDDGGTLYGGVDLDPTPATMTINVTPVNDAPVLVAGGPNFTTIDENQTAGGGQTVASVLAGITDVDSGALTGMAVHATSVGGVAGGSWQYNLNDANGWHAMGAVSDSAAMLLRSTDLIRFVPDTVGGTTGTLSYYAWDQATGTAGTPSDVSTRGDATAYSLVSDDVGITVTDVNDAPTITTPGGQTAAEDGSTTVTGISFGDVDITGRVDGDTTNNDVSVTLGVAHGAITLGGTTDITVTAGANGSATMTLHGSLAAVNTAVASLGYAPSADFQGSDSLSISIDDLGNVGSGGPLTAATSVAITVTPTNDAPIDNPVARSLVSITEDNLNPIGQAVGSLLDSSDVDSGASTANNGTGQGMAIYGLHNDGPGTGTWQYSTDGSTWLAIGSVSSSQALLLEVNDAVRFVPDGQNATTAHFDFYVWDGASGVAGTKVDASTRGGTTAFSVGSDSATINVTAVNDAPTLDLDANNSSGATGNDYVATFRARGDAVAVVDGDITIGDPDHTASATDTLASARMTITAGDLDNLFGTTYETLSSTAGASYAGSLGAITFSGNGTTASPLLLSGAGTWADYQNALKTVVYSNTNPNAFAGDRTVQISVHDAAGTSGGSGALDSGVATTTIHGVWAPVADLDGSATPGRSNAVTFTEGSSGVAIASPIASIVDQDGNIASVTVSITNHPDGNAEKLSISPTLVSQLALAGITVSGNDSWSITLSGNRDGTTFQLGLRAIQYVNTSDDPSSQPRTVSVALVDQSGNTGVGANTIVTVVGVNDAPVGVDSAVTLAEDTPQTLAISDFGYTDLDNHSLLSVKITTLPTAGVLRLDGSAVIAGQFVSAIDIAAGKLVFTPALNANEVQNPNGSGAYASLTYQVRDSGGTAGGGVDLDASANVLTIHVTAVNDLPTGGVSLGGTSRVGQVLTAQDTIADVDGLAAKSYQWQVRSLPAGGWTNIGGANASTYTLTGAEANQEVRFVLSYDDAPSAPVIYTSDVVGAPILVADASGNVTVTVASNDPVVIDNPQGDITLTNNGPGTVTVNGLPGTSTLTTSGSGDTTVADPADGATVINNGSGTTTVTGVDGTLHTGGTGSTVVDAPADGSVIDDNGSGPLTVNDPVGSVTVNNGGGGTATVNHAADGSTVTTSGPVTIADPLGDLTLAGTGSNTVTGLTGGAILATTGSGDTTVVAPADGAVINDASSGALIVNDPVGNLTVGNAGGGTATVNHMVDGATLTTSGPVAVVDPLGDLTLAGSGDNSVSGLDGASTLTTTGSGSTHVTAPADGASVINNGSGTTTVSGVDGTLHSGGSGAVVVDAPANGATIEDTGSGALTVSHPVGDLTLHNGNGGSAVVDGPIAGSTLTTSGDVSVAAPAGDLSLVNQGGNVDVQGLADGATLHTSGLGNSSATAPSGDVVIDNAGPGTATVSALGAGHGVTSLGSGPVSIDQPVGDFHVDNLGSGLVTLSHLDADSTVAANGSGPIVADLAGLAAGHGVTFDHSGSGTLDVLHAPVDTTVHSTGGSDVAVTDPVGNVTLDNSGSGLLYLTGAADGAVVTTAGSGATDITGAAGSFTLDNTGTGTVTLHGVEAGQTVVLQGSGPVVIDTHLAAGEHLHVDTTLNSNVHIDNSGAGTVDVTGPLALDAADPVHLSLTGTGVTPMTADGTVTLADTPLVLDLNYAAHVGDHITLLSNTSANPIVGHFADKPEGASFYLGGQLFSISYVGGDGNDIVLSRINDLPSGAVTVTGTATQGEVLTASQNLADTDGLGAVTMAWLRGDTIVGTGLIYTLGQADVGASLHAVASYTDAEGTVEHVGSAASAAVANVNDAPTGNVSISGTATQGRTLTASHTLADLDGLGAITYHWMNGSTELATGDSYTLGQGDVDQSIHVVATYTDGFGANESVTSAATTPVANVNDAPTGAVAISGIADEGQTLAASHTLADIDGLGAVSYSWLRGSTVVGSGSSYTLTQADVGSAVHAVASYTDGYGTVEHVASGNSGVINAVNSVVEAAVPTHGNVVGDGNGDGIADVTQADVVSTQVTPISGTGAGTPAYVTLVAGSNAGMATADSGAQVTSFTQSDTFVAPPMATMPLGEIAFTATAPTGNPQEAFSLFVDASVGANGFWVHDAAGTLVNLASTAYGGQVVQDGDRTRLDFKVTDGSAFDADAALNGSVQLAGLAGHMPLSLIAYHPDLPTDSPNHPLFWS